NDLFGNISFLRSMDAHTNAVGPFNGVPLTADDNHGTYVAGLIAANGILVGAAYEATLISEYSRIVEGNPADSVNAFNHSATYADVMNNSWSYGPALEQSPNNAFIADFKLPGFSAAGTAIANAGLNGRGGLGTILVTAAGNSRAFGDDTNLDNFRN